MGSEGEGETKGVATIAKKTKAKRTKKKCEH